MQDTAKIEQQSAVSIPLLDVAAIRRDFPALHRSVNGYPLAYLDNTAATLKPQAVIDALADFYARHPANVHRGIHVMSEEASEDYEKAREHIVRFINAPSADELIFTRNTTEGLNLLSSCLGAQLRPGDEILCTELEHHANLVPWQMLRDRLGIVLRFARVLPSGRLDLDDWHSKLSARTKIVTFTHVSNVTGAVNPVALLTRAAHDHGAVVILDAAQGIPHLGLDVQAEGIDFAVCSGYKMLAPFGIGAVWGRYELLDKLPPYQTGGNMISSVALEETSFAGLPHRFEAGTPAVGDAIGWDAALSYIESVGFEAIRQHEEELSQYLHARLAEVPGLTIVGDYFPGKPGIASFSMDCAHPHDISQFLNEEGVAVRAGFHCAEPLHTALGVGATVRASLYLYNTRADVDQLIGALATVREVFA